jgi:hypothetical protein
MINETPELEIARLRGQLARYRAAVEHYFEADAICPDCGDNMVCSVDCKYMISNIDDWERVQVARRVLAMLNKIIE